MLDAGYKRVSQAAEIPTRSPELHTHERLSEELIIQDFGYLQVYVSNSSQQESEVFFDDLSVMQLSSNVVRAHDYYPYGLKMVTGLGNIEDEDYRWGFQGAFSEEDEETGWNSFQYRSWDPVVSRWISPDPARQYFSPYMGMGNNPINQIDPDGAYSKFGAWWRNGFSSNGLTQSGGEWGYMRKMGNSTSFEVNGKVQSVQESEYVFGENKDLNNLRDIALNGTNISFDNFVGYDFDVKNVALSSAQLGAGLWFTERANSIREATFSGNKWTAKALANSSDKAPLFATRIGGGTKTLNFISAVKIGGSVASVYSYYDNYHQYRSKNLSLTSLIIEQTSNTIGFIPTYGTAWSIGWEAGKRWGPSKWYGNDDTKWLR